MANPVWFKKNLPDILYPQGNNTTGLPQPNVIPDVLDSDGNPVFFTSTKRFVSQVTGVDVGDSPNSNTGDPLRTAFVKLDNITEALYRNDAGKSYRLAQLEQPGRFLGILDYSQLPLPPQKSIPDPTVTANAHVYPQNGDWAILRTRIGGDTATTMPVFQQNFPFINTTSASLINTSTFTSNIYVDAYSVLQWNTSLSRNSSTKIGDTSGTRFNLYPQYGAWQVVAQEGLKNFNYNVDQALARLSVGAADWYGYDSESGPIGLAQQELYQNFVNQSAQNVTSKRIQSRNFEDAVTELLVRSTINQIDAGYYG